MSVDEWLVIAGGVAAIGWVNRYFFPSGGAAGPAASADAGARPVEVRVRGGYDPAHVTAKVGAPVRLVFDRQETSGCSEEVVFPDLGVRKFLRPLEKTVVELRPEKPGTYEFTCGMGMLRGRLTVEA